MYYMDRAAKHDPYLPLVSKVTQALNSVWHHKYGIATSKPIKFKASFVLANRSNLDAALFLLSLD